MVDLGCEIIERRNVAGGESEFSWAIFSLFQSSSTPASKFDYYLLEYYIEFLECITELDRPLPSLNPKARMF